MFTPANMYIRGQPPAADIWDGGAVLKVQVTGPSGTPAPLGTATDPTKVLTVDSTGAEKVSGSEYVNSQACQCATATTAGDGGTIGAQSAADAGSILTPGQYALFIGSNSDITLARNAACNAYASGGATASIPSGGWAWTVPAPNADGGVLTTWYSTCSQSGTTRVCLCPRSAVAP
jgi:hypothetical protein